MQDAFIGVDPGAAPVDRTIDFAARSEPPLSRSVRASGGSLVQDWARRLPCCRSSQRAAAAIARTRCSTCASKTMRTGELTSADGIVRWRDRAMRPEPMTNWSSSCAWRFSLHGISHRAPVWRRTCSSACTATPRRPSGASRWMRLPALAPTRRRCNLAPRWSTAALTGLPCSAQRRAPIRPRCAACSSTACSSRRGAAAN